MALPGRSGGAMEKKDGNELGEGQKAQGVWERRTQDRRWGQNQLFGSVRIGSGVKGVSNGDPTDNALAAIASILEKPAEPIRRPAVPPPLPAAEKPAASPVTAGAENFRFSGSEANEPVSAASPSPSPEPVLALPPAPAPDPLPSPVPATPPPPVVAAEVDGYVKFGPGPLDAIRFKWSARPAGNGSYFVDETIGSSSRAMTSGPMSKDDAIKFIDTREADAWRRFNALKNEMTGSGASYPPPLPGEK
jgi:hypothetical protein